jgi:hypothetical protein
MEPFEAVITIRFSGGSKRGFILEINSKIFSFASRKTKLATYFVDLFLGLPIDLEDGGYMSPEALVCLKITR